MFMMFLYTKICVFEEYSLDVCLDLCKIADKYEVMLLRDQLFEHLVSIVSVETCITLYLTADAYSWTMLKQGLAQYIAKSWKKLLNSCADQIKGLSSYQMAEISSYML